MTKHPTSERRTKSYPKASLDNLATALIHIERKQLVEALGIRPNALRSWENAGQMPLGASNHCALLLAQAAEPAPATAEHAVIVAKVSGHDTISTVRAILEKFSPNAYTLNC